MKRVKDPLWARLLLGFGLVLSVGSGSTLAVTRTLISQAEESITQTDLIGGTGDAARPAGNDIDGAVNMLLVGIDAREGDQDFRADTIIVLHVPETHDQAYLISIPRDWMVDIPANDEFGFPGATEKINAAFYYGSRLPGTDLEKRGRGTEVLAATLRKHTGIEFNGAAVIDFGGFHSIVHALGGVDMCVAEPAESVHLASTRRASWSRAGTTTRSIRPGWKGCRRAACRWCTSRGVVRWTPPGRWTTRGSGRAWTTATTGGSSTSSS